MFKFIRQALVLIGSLFILAVFVYSIHIQFLTVVNMVYSEGVEVGVGSCQGEAFFEPANEYDGV
jgi:hypothetical protein